MRRVFIFAFLLVLSAASFADDNGKKVGVGIGIGAGLYLPTDSHIRDLFGASIFSFGIDVGGTPKVDSGKFGYALGAVDARKNGNSFFLGQAMGSYTLLLDKSNTNVQPYAQAAAGIAYADYAITDNNGHSSAKQFTPTGRAELGVIFNESLKISVAYDFFGTVGGFHFNGLALKATYTIFKF